MESRPHIFCTAQTTLRTKYGSFSMLIYHDNSEKQKKDHIALVKGNVAHTQKILTRIHSECITGDIFCSMRCDCGEQLHTALKLISREQQGILLYLRQEGRGIGLVNKILAYKLQEEQGLDTVAANTALGLPIDMRNYLLAVAILEDLKIDSIRLLTNNPEKISIFKSSHITCVERVPIEVTSNPYNRHYLKTKRDKIGHFLEKERSKFTAEIDYNLSQLKFIGFFDDTMPHYELSNFGGEGDYINQYGDRGQYTEITYQACKFVYLQDKQISKKLKKQFLREVNLPFHAFEFMKTKRPELKNKSINDCLKKSRWDCINNHGISNKETEMIYCLVDKFNPIKNKKTFLKLMDIMHDDKVVLVEKSPHDGYWGYKNTARNRLGKNKLGLMLTALALTTKQLNDINIAYEKKITALIINYKLFLERFNGLDFYDVIHSRTDE